MPKSLQSGANVGGVLQLPSSSHVGAGVQGLQSEELLIVLPSSPEHNNIYVGA